MRPAPARRPDPSQDRLLVLDGASWTLSSRRFGELDRTLRSGDHVVVNDAATLPAALVATVERPSGPVELELRLFGGTDAQRFALALGPGSSRLPTEERRDPPRMETGDVLSVASIPFARVLEIDGDGGRLLRLAAIGSHEAFLKAVYRAGRPVQYAYVDRDLALWDVQTSYASRPFASEMPSAGRPITFAMLGALRRAGVGVSALTHGAGLSSTGSASLDRRLPLPEAFSVPGSTLRAIRAARARGGRVIAIGTTVVRALEAVGRIPHTPGKAEDVIGETDLLIGPDTKLTMVDGVLTGMHEPGTSHFRLLQAFAPERALLSACALADHEGYFLHEFGDSMLVVPGPA